MHEFTPGPPDEKLIKLSDVWRSAVLDDLLVGSSVYPDHPSLNQLIFLINRDAKKFNQQMPFWLTERARSIGQGAAFDRPQYLCPQSSVYIRAGQAEGISHTVHTPLGDRP